MPLCASPDACCLDGAAPQYSGLYDHGSVTDTVGGC